MSEEETTVNLPKYEVYTLDCETTGLDPIKNSPVEISIIRRSTGEQKTWFLKAVGNQEDISKDALRVNGYKLEDVLCLTKEGKEKFRDPQTVLIEIENWIMEDNIDTANRVLAGQNIPFDIDMLKQLWKKLNSEDSYPFGRRFVDTMVIEFFMDMCKENYKESYSLNGISKHYGIKNEKAHTGEADTRVADQVLDSQIKLFQKALKSLDK